MRPFTALTIAALCGFLLSFDRAGLVGQPMPIIPGQTLEGQNVDADYFRGHITLVTFMYIGCPPCMNEIAALNRIQRDFAADSIVRVLCIARQTAQQMQQFNAEDGSVFSQIRKAFRSESIQYAVLPACAESDSKIVRTGESI